MRKPAKVTEWVVWTGAVGVLVFTPAPVIVSTVYADTNEQVQAANKTATAEAKATADAANFCAQGALRGTPCTPTPTPVPTRTPVPARDLVLPTQAPAEPTATPTPLPGLPAASSQAPISGYVRPLGDQHEDSWQELAVPDGRWNVALVGCDVAPADWTNVWLWTDENGTSWVTDPNAYAAQGNTAFCAVQQAVWHSNAACAADAAGVCNAYYDPAFWQAVADGQAQQPPANAPPTDTPTPAPSLAPTPARAPAPAAQQPPAPRTVYVQQPPEIKYVPVTVTATPADDNAGQTDDADASPTAVVSTYTPWWLITPTATATDVATDTPTPEPTDAAAAATSDDDPPTASFPGIDLFSGIGQVVAGFFSLIGYAALGVSTVLACATPVLMGVGAHQVLAQQPQWAEEDE